MHISEGILSGPVLISGAALAAAGTAVGLKKLDYDRIARAGILSAAFFVASLIGAQSIASGCFWPRRCEKNLVIVQFRR